jgi:hypothetical protein
MEEWTLLETQNKDRSPFDPDQQWIALCKALHWTGTEEELLNALEELKSRLTHLAEFNL